MSAIVINKDSGIPGPGYFDYFYGINRCDLDSQIICYKKDIESILKQERFM